MPRAESSSEPRRNDWLPWFLAVFGAGCAVFTLLKGVMPAQSANAQLVEKVARLESAAQAASSEVESLEQSKGELQQQFNTAQAQLASSKQEREREQQARETARREMNQTFSTLIAAGDLWLEQRAAAGSEQLVIGIRDQLLFNGARSEVTRQGRQLLKALAENLKHLPSDQVYEVGGHFDPEASSDNADEEKPRGKRAAKSRTRPAWEISARRAASVVRYLEEAGLAGSQLVAAGFSKFQPSAAPDKQSRIEIVLRPLESKSASGTSTSGALPDTKMRSAL
jgi:chemotaxis protein MotB